MTTHPSTTTTLHNPTSYHLDASQKWHLPEATWFGTHGEQTLTDLSEPVVMLNEDTTFNLLPSTVEQGVLPLPPQRRTQVLSHQALGRQHSDGLVFNDSLSDDMCDSVGTSSQPMACGSYSQSVNLPQYPIQKAWPYLGNPSTTAQMGYMLPGYPNPRSPPSTGHMNPLSLALSPTGLGSPSTEDDLVTQQNLQRMMAKRRRRRESHNAVERRRRENINERIHQLGSLLPQTMLEECTLSSTGGITKPNKGAILRKSVDHIKLLRQDVITCQQRIRTLEQELRSLIQART